MLIVITVVLVILVQIFSYGMDALGMSCVVETEVQSFH